MVGQLVQYLPPDWQGKYWGERVCGGGDAGWRMKGQKMADFSES
jgi:hypothetical protein